MTALYGHQKCIRNIVVDLHRAQGARNRQEVIVKALKAAHEVRGLTGDELLGLPAVIDLDTANRALMIGRSTGYGLARQGDYPVRVLRLGNAYRVVTADLLKLLGLERQPAVASRTDDVGSEHGLCA
jgi:hypothetical protein